jgi:hypothetical protein
MTFLLYLKPRMLSILFYFLQSIHFSIAEVDTLISQSNRKLYTTLFFVKRIRFATIFFFLRIIATWAYNW